MDQEIDDIMEKTTPKVALPEAPLSIHIDSYINGFHVGFTKRFTENNASAQILSMKAFVNMLIENGYKPSWNQDTNQKATNIPENLGKCAKCGAPNFKSTKTGKPYCSAKCWLQGGQNV